MRILELSTTEIYTPLCQPARYKGTYGGRGAGKSHFFAEAVVQRCVNKPGTRVVCVREVQRSLKESVKRLIEDKIEFFQSGDKFTIQNDRILTHGGGVILFQGMRDHTAESIKSLEGFDIGYVETGIAPIAALNSLLGLAATGEAGGRIAAARELIAVFNADPTVRDRVPPSLAGLADTLVHLADTDAIPPKEIVMTADAQFSDGTTDGDAGRANPALIQLAKAQTSAGVQTDGQSDAESGDAKGDAQPDTPAGAAPPQVSDDGESGDDAQFDEDDLFFDDEDIDGEEEDEIDVAGSPLFQGIQTQVSQESGSDKERPTGSLGSGLDAAENANRARQASVKPVDPLLAEFVGLINPAVRAAITANEGAKGFEAFKEMKEAQASGDQNAADDARDRMVSALLGAVPGGRLFKRGKAAKAAETGIAPQQAIRSLLGLAVTATVMREEGGRAHLSLTPKRKSS